MRYFLTIGGSLGFATALTASLLAGNPLANCLVTAGAGSLAGALLFRWLHSVFMSAIRSHLEAKAAEISIQPIEPPNES